MSVRSESQVIRVGLIGYGPQTGMGKHHADCIAKTDALETVAVADIDPRALQQARQKLGEEILTFDSARKMLADVQISNVAFVGRPRWRILGTKGAIEDWHVGSFTVYTEVKGYPAQIEVEYLESRYPEFYKNVAAHLTQGTELAVKPEEAARTIAIMEYAERSSKQGKTLRAPCP